MNAPLRNFQPDSPERVASALSMLDPTDRELWVKMSFAVKDALGDAGFEVWDAWSQRGANYNVGAAKATWRSASAGGKVRASSLFYEARQLGWRDDSKPVLVDPAELERQRAALEARRQAEAAQLAREHAEAAARAEQLWEAAAPASDDHPYLIEKKVRAYGLRVGPWTVTDRGTGEVRRVSNNALLVPLRDRKGKLHGLQAIFASKCLAGRNKDYLAGAAKSGHFYAIGAPKEHKGRRVFVLVEGFATGATIHSATGHCVLVCFDAGNLTAVARSIHERQPEAAILLAADNDQWSRRADGTPHNPGVAAAKKAAAEVGGLLAVPPFPASAGAVGEGGPTDFNDLAAAQGEDVVRMLIEAALDGSPVVPDPDGESSNSPEAEQEPASDEAPWGDEAEPATTIEPQAASAAPADGGDDGEESAGNHGGVPEGYFRVLGFNRKTIYIYAVEKKQVVEYTARDFSETGLLELADANWWELHFPGNNGGINRKSAANAIIRLASRRGIYDPGMVRGRGAWWDNERLVVHLGDRLLVQGKETGLADIPRSRFVYEQASPLADVVATPLTSEEGQRISSIASLFRWERSVSADMLCGWAFLAPICGALKWRPHIWVTGGAGSGKTSVLESFVRRLLPESVPIFANGDSSEAGLRQELDSEARPLLIDESESDDEKARAKIESVITMIRQSSSDTAALTFRGTVGGRSQSFALRTMACLSSIGVALKQQQDMERVSVLALRPNRDDRADTPWEVIKEELRWIAKDPTIGARMLNRAIGMIDVIMAAVDVFTSAAALILGTQRNGDQIGTLLAGSWCLQCDRAPTFEEAEKVLNSIDWEEFKATHRGEPADLIATLLGRPVLLEGGLRTTVGLLVQRAAGLEAEGLEYMEPKKANTALHLYGLKVVAEELRVHTANPELERLLTGTKFCTGLHERMRRIAGATTKSGQPFRIGAAIRNGVILPLSSVLDASIAEEGEFPV